MSSKVNKALSSVIKCHQWSSRVIISSSIINHHKESSSILDIASWLFYIEDSAPPSVLNIALQLSSIKLSVSPPPQASSSVLNIASQLSLIKCSAPKSPSRLRHSLFHPIVILIKRVQVS